MNKIRKKYFLFLLRNEYIFDILTLILLSLSCLFLSCLTYDTNKLNSLSKSDYYVYRLLGLTGITIQSYFFPFVVLVIALILLDIVYNKLNISNIQANLFLLQIKGYSKIKKETNLFHALFSFVTCNLSIALYVIFYLILNLIFKTEVPIFAFNVNILYLILAYFIYDFIVYKMVLNFKTKYRKLLTFLREKY